ncbi:hypothetical protein T484DRAFT_1853797 [Baffinella frigidus]|nr:hypothetical protein T484DRAFT_1853797 [Cryptophyta sp. CCMP2293]
MFRQSPSGDQAAAGGTLKREARTWNDGEASARQLTLRVQSGVNFSRIRGGEPCNISCLVRLVRRKDGAAAIASKLVLDRTQFFRTTTQSGPHPVWNETFELAVTSVEEQCLEITMWDQSSHEGAKGRSECVGQIVVQVDKVPSGPIDYIALDVQGCHYNFPPSRLPLQLPPEKVA